MQHGGNYIVTVTRSAMNFLVARVGSGRGGEMATAALALGRLCSSFDSFLIDLCTAD
jgi:hypothetical protein